MELKRSTAARSGRRFSALTAIAKIQQNLLLIGAYARVHCCAATAEFSFVISVGNAGCTRAPESQALGRAHNNAPKHATDDGQRTVSG